MVKYHDIIPFSLEKKKRSSLILEVHAQHAINMTSIPASLHTAHVGSQAQQTQATKRRTRDTTVCSANYINLSWVLGSRLSIFHKNHMGPTQTLIST